MTASTMRRVYWSTLTVSRRRRVVVRLPRIEDPPLEQPELHHRQHETDPEQGNGQHRRDAVVVAQECLLVQVVGQDAGVVDRAALRQEIDLTEGLEGGDASDDRREHQRRRKEWKGDLAEAPPRARSVDPRCLEQFVGYRLQ